MEQRMNKDDGIVSLRAKKPAKQKDNIMDVILFTSFGKRDGLVDLDGNEDENGWPFLDSDDYSDENKLAYAKVDHNGSQPRYFVKMTGRGFFANPNGLFDDDSVQRTGGKKLPWKYIKVSRDCFLLYIKFLKTNNQLYFREAMRTIS